ncbi:hypothetical protein TWF696_008996 [Orbilia brochopaga]|uniref:Uncharacterized protein n=1 Tax=Orbilia brochopaga TaxID=3140254 RepID=A0AAV9UEV0_9PEZI
MRRTSYTVVGKSGNPDFHRCPQELSRGQLLTQFLPVPGLQEGQEPEDDPTITLAELYGANDVPAGYEPDTKLPLSLEELQFAITDGSEKEAPVVEK